MLLIARKYREWTEAVPALCAIRNGYRRKSNVSDNSTVNLGHKRDSQCIGSTQGMYYELLGVIADRKRPEGRYCDFGYCRNILNRFLPYDHIKLRFV